jgi:hypothetical protein
MMLHEKSPFGFWQLGAVLGLGLAAGTLFGWLDFSNVKTSRPDLFLVMQSTDVLRDGMLAAESKNSNKGQSPKFPVVEVVGVANHNFGVSQPGVVMEHTFVIRNRGEAPLELRLQETTCKCLTMTLDTKKPTLVQPGEQHPVTLQFRSDKATESFVQKAKIKTNDPHPNRNTLRLQVEGRIVSRTTIKPDGLEVSDLMSANSDQFAFNLYTFAIDNIDPATIDIESVTCDNQILNEKLQFSWKPLSPAEIQAEYQAVGGFQVTGVIPAGMPMNNYGGNIYVKTTDGSEAYLGISMKVKAPVTIRGINNSHGNTRFFEEAQYIDFGLVKPGQAAEMELLFNYRTDKKGELDFKVTENSHPDLLEVEVKDIRRSPSATLVRLRVAIRPDAPPALLNGPKRDNMANVKIQTDSEEAPEVNLAVSVSKN